MEHMGGPRTGDEEGVNEVEAVQVSAPLSRRGSLVSAWAIWQTLDGA